MLFRAAATTIVAARRGGNDMLDGATARPDLGW